jgi:hypothetical protein
MACNVTKGRDKVCRYNIGGLRAVYIGNGPDFASGVSYNTAGYVTNLPTADVYKYDLEGQHGHGSYTDDAQISAENHTVFYQPTVMMMLPGMTVEDQRELTRMIASNNLYIFAEDNNGKIWMVENAQVSANNATSGQQVGDFNGYTVTFQSNMRYKPYLLLGEGGAFALYPNITVVTGTNS